MHDYRRLKRKQGDRNDSEFDNYNISATKGRLRNWQ